MSTGLQIQYFELSMFGFSVTQLCMCRQKMSFVQSFWNWLLLTVFGLMFWFFPGFRQQMNQKFHQKNLPCWNSQREGEGKQKRMRCKRNRRTGQRQLRNQTQQTLSSCVGEWEQGPDWLPGCQMPTCPTKRRFSRSSGIHSARFRFQTDCETSSQRWTTTSYQPGRLPCCPGLWFSKTEKTLRG